MTPQFLILGVIWYIVFLLSTTCHEGAHALAAKLGGDPTAFRGGQVTLNPLPHIRREPIGTVVVPILSYVLAQWMIGWASAPYDPLWAERHPRQAAWMALAGPGANFALMILAILGIRLGMATGEFLPPRTASLSHVADAVHPGVAEFAATFLSILFVLNLLLGTFNLLPVPPLDGHNGITVLMREETARKFLEMTRASGLGMAGILLAWVIYDRLFHYLFVLGLALLYPGLGYG